MTTCPRGALCRLHDIDVAQCRFPLGDNVNTARGRGIRSVAVDFYDSLLAIRRPKETERMAYFVIREEGEGVSYQGSLTSANKSNTISGGRGEFC